MIFSLFCLVNYPGLINNTVKFTLDFNWRSLGYLSEDILLLTTLSVCFTLFIVTPEEVISTKPGEVKFDRDRDTLFIRCQVCVKQSIYFTCSQAIK